MTIHHVVSLWLERSAPDALRDLADAAGNLRQIPGVISADFARNTQGHGGAADGGLFVVFESQQAVDRYMPHPLHKRMIATVQRHARRVEPVFMQSLQPENDQGSAETIDEVRRSSARRL
ncbi:Dabb family protein [Brucella pseudogrignonensis]|uniref:Dabb family protein n=1 Tax=Brucella pseudogrignonensis TaxID=419475 RepID=UPI001ED9CB2B|nr:Dabb family protein [Brucella pseudogrignonensis]UKK94694.1 Dabb family protein [Brucella pseudogrignonensis]